MNNRIKMTDSKFKCNIFLFLSVTVFMARLSICQSVSFFCIETKRHQHVRPLLQLAPTNSHRARVVGYGPFALCVIHKEGLYPSSVRINALKMTLESIIEVLYKTAF
jgi:hypothetical protein